MNTYEITYLPAEWQDECIPETMRHPIDFVHKCEDGSFIIIPKKSKDDLTPDGDLEDQEHMLFNVNIGEVVHFQPTEQYGTFTLTIVEGGASKVDGDFPAKANTFYLPETETIGDSVEDVIRQSVESYGPLATGKYDIDIYWWGDGIAYRFDVAPDGSPHFVEARAAQ